MANQRTRATRDRRYRTKKAREDERAAQEREHTSNILAAAWNGRREGHDDGVHQERERQNRERVLHLNPFTRRDGAHTDPYFLNDQPQRDRVELVFSPDPRTRMLDMNNPDVREREYQRLRTDLELQRVVFQAKRYCWQSGGGQMVNWWGWEERGVDLFR